MVHIPAAWRAGGIHYIRVLRDQRLGRGCRLLATSGSAAAHMRLPGRAQYTVSSTRERLCEQQIAVNAPPDPLLPGDDLLEIGRPGFGPGVGLGASPDAGWLRRLDLGHHRRRPGRRRQRDAGRPQRYLAKGGIEGGGDGSRKGLQQRGRLSGKIP